MTEKTLDWLNQNRFRAYPFVNDSGLLYSGKRIPDCVLLDCIVVDTRHYETPPELIFSSIKVTTESTVITFSYADIDYTYTLSDRVDSSSSSSSSSSDSSGSDSSDDDLKNNDDTIAVVNGSLVSNFRNELLYVKFVFSSHEYILSTVGTGTWYFKGKIIPTKIITVEASGVSGIKVNGSENVSGFDLQGVATGEVHLVDGYRTQPVIQDGSVIVKVGTMYGEDPCRYSDNLNQDNENVNCDDLLLFFCGQNGGTNGNVVVEGGPGVTVKQGSTYKAKSNIQDTYGNVGIQNGEEIPCVEIVASTDLLNIYRPS